MSELNQRHQLVLLFTDLTDSTRIAARLEPEHYADLLNQLRQHTNTIIARHGGEVVRVDGDGALCIFGYPLAHEDAGRRATEAALDLHAAVAELAGETAVSLHSGIHAGVVLLRGGDLVRGRYEMLGDATNVAARLCDAAGPGGILVSEETLGADQHFFQTSSERWIALSGHSEPLRVLPVIARQDVPHRFATREIRGLSPFVGRQGEREQIKAWLGTAAHAAPVMLIHGPAGIGKSRLLKVLAGDFTDRGWEVARGYCEGYLGAPPLQPLLQIGVSLDSEFAADSDPSARIEALIRTNAAHPLLLAIDDWQWADDASRSLIARLAFDSPPSLRLLLISREADPSLAPECKVATVSLGPLDRKSARTTIENLLTSKDPFAVAQIEGATGGSPLLIEELCHAYADHGAGAASSKLRGAWFDLSVQSRYAALAAEDAQLLRLAAVIGHVVAPWLLAGVRGRAIEGAMLERLQNADFLFPGDSGDVLQFKHGLTRDAVYAAIGLAERKELHSQVLLALEERAELSDSNQLLDALACHAVAAGEVAKGLKASLAAGEAALLAGAFDRAQMHHLAAYRCFKVAKPDGSIDTPLSEIITRFGRSCVIDPSRDQLPVLAEMVDLAQTRSDRRGHELALFWSGSVRFALGDVKIAITQLQAVLRLADPEERPSFVAQVKASIGECWYDAGDLQRAVEMLTVAVDILESELSEGRQMAYLYALANLGQIHGELGDFAAAEATFARIDMVIGDSAPPIASSLLVQRAGVSIWRGRYAEAVALASRAEALARRDRSRQNAMIGQALRSYAQFVSSGNATEIEGLVGMLDWVESSTYRHRASLYYGWGADAMARLGDEGATRRYAARAFSLARHGDGLGEATAARAMARLAARGGRGRGPEFYLAIARSADARRQSAWSAAETVRCAGEVAELRLASSSH